MDHKKFQQLKNFWGISFVGALALSYLSAAVFFSNPFGLYSPRKLALGLLAVPVFFLALSFLWNQIWLPRQASVSKKNRVEMILWSTAVAIILLLAFPNPRPLIPQYHQLKLVALGEKVADSAGSIVEIRQVQALDGKAIASEQIRISGDWQFVDGILFSPRGGPQSIAEFEGDVAGGVVIYLRYLGDGGKVHIFWDGNERTISSYTYSSSSTIEKIVLDGFLWAQLTPIEFGLVILSDVVYFLGMFILVLLVSMCVRLKLVRPKLAHILLALAYLVIFGIYLDLKFSFDEFGGNRPFPDSRSYIRNADLSLTSLEFWAGERSFTFPLALKLLNVRVADQWSNAVMERVQVLHVGMSIFSWGLLAFLISWYIRQKWLKPFAFGCILWFSLSLDIGLWDGLMLSESLALSLFALMLAGWLGGMLLLDSKCKRWILGMYGVALALVTVLYSFTRDSNQYFLLLAAAIFVLMLVLKKSEPGRRAVLGYVLILVLTVVLQTLSLSIGNRWQIFIYDHLAQRILADDSARAFFAAHGLPVNDDLMAILDVRMGGVYQSVLQNDPKLLPVRQWVNESGKTTYFLYLLSDPGRSLWEPLQQANSLVNGRNQLYHFPVYASHPFSDKIVAITTLFYFRSPVIEWLAVGGLLLISIIWIFKGRGHSPWLIVVILALSIYPMMFIVWHGEPLEIGRHALQIAIQLRLATWMALILGIDLISRPILSNDTGR